jgi:sugar phosphate isomerase/epimerase
MKNPTRRDFLKTSAFAGLAFATTSFDFYKYTPRLSFVTLACPDWNFETILNNASKYGYSGIEIRGIQRQMDITQCPEFSKANLAATKKRIEDKKLKIVDMGSNAKMHISDPTERKNGLDEAKRFIHLAQELNCPFVKVFPNNLPKDQERNQTFDLITKGLTELGDYAKGTGVRVLMETHGDLVHLADLERIMHTVEHPNVGLVWDICNMWSVTKEPVTEVYPKLKKYIYHTHIKDIKFVGDKKELAFLGKGDAPTLQAVDLLAKDGFTGYFSFEWEKYYHPEVQEPEVALPDYVKVMKEHFKV